MSTFFPDIPRSNKYKKMLVNKKQNVFQVVKKFLLIHHVELENNVFQNVSGILLFKNKGNGNHLAEDGVGTTIILTAMNRGCKRSNSYFLVVISTARIQVKKDELR